MRFELFQERNMRRPVLVSLAFGLMCGLGTWAWGQAQQQPGKLVDGISGKRMYVEAKDGISFMLTKTSLRQLGGRQFLVGTGEGDQRFGNAPIWIPLDAVTVMAEYEAV